MKTFLAVIFSPKRQEHSSCWIAHLWLEGRNTGGGGLTINQKEAKEEIETGNVNTKRPYPGSVLGSSPTQEAKSPPDCEQSQESNGKPENIKPKISGHATILKQRDLPLAFKFLLKFLESIRKENAFIWISMKADAKIAGKRGFMEPL
jgi:hypothetical protein